MVRHFIAASLLLMAGWQVESQDFSEILGRPTRSAVTLSILFDRDVEAYWEVGRYVDDMTVALPAETLTREVPHEVRFTNLQPDTRYYYHTRYRNAGSGSEYLAGPGHSFHTARAPGSTYSFAIEADPHLDANSNEEAYRLTLVKMASLNPDFVIDLGDTFFSEKQPEISQATVTARHVLYRPLFGSVCHSSPLFLVLGNHEGESGWHLDGTPDNIAVMAANTRNLYYPNPAPDDFYSGNAVAEPFVGLRRNYYAWEWGDALFVVLDPYWYTTKKPGWGWTLGPDQYWWFRQTLEQSRSPFKFVFCHNLVGGDGNDARGGAEFAGLFEMGGYNTDGSWGFTDNRPGWDKPIHQLMVENRVTIFFHGHDHFYGKQEKDGVIYQEVPQPSTRNATNIQAANYGYVNGLFLVGRGYLNVTVSAEETAVEYLRTWLPGEETLSRKNGEVADSYRIFRKSAARQPENGFSPGPFLDEIWPNPVQGKAILRYTLANPEKIRIGVYDIHGRLTDILYEGMQMSGSHSLEWVPKPATSVAQTAYVVLETAEGRIYRRIIIL